MMSPTGTPTSAIEKDELIAHLRRKAAAKRRVVVHSEDDGEGNWLVSYADMMTLLFGFFVIISAFSTPDAAKVEAMKQQTAESMGGKYTRPYEDLANAVKKTLSEVNLGEEISVQQTAEGVIVVSSGTVFFDSGSANLKPEAEKLMGNIATILAEKAKDFRIFIEGHTDDSPIVSKQFPSNWELSAARASSVVRLLEGKGMLRTQLRPLGFADTEPLFPNRDPNGTVIAENQARNRRIVIKIQRMLPSRTSK
jgi:chemotaxis protein MotB